MRLSSGFSIKCTTFTQHLPCLRAGCGQRKLGTPSKTHKSIKLFPIPPWGEKKNFNIFLEPFIETLKMGPRISVDFTLVVHNCSTSRLPDWVFVSGHNRGVKRLCSAYSGARLLIRGNADQDFWLSHSFWNPRHQKRAACLFPRGIRHECK